MLLRILSYHQVMPRYIDMISMFGSLLEARESHCSGFRGQTHFSDPPPGLVLPRLGRSGKQYEMCYHLRTVSCISKKGTIEYEQKWIVRPAAIYHQLDIVYGTTFWMITNRQVDDIKGQVQDITGKDGREEDKWFGTPEECFRSSLAIHLLHCNWATQAWRGYLLWREFIIDDKVSTPVDNFMPDLQLQIDRLGRLWGPHLLWW